MCELIFEAQVFFVHTLESGYRAVNVSLFSALYIKFNKERNRVHFSVYIYRGNYDNCHCRSAVIANVLCVRMYFTISIRNNNTQRELSLSRSMCPESKEQKPKCLF